MAVCFFGFVCSCFLLHCTLTCTREERGVWVLKRLYKKLPSMKYSGQADFSLKTGLITPARLPVLLVSFRLERGSRNT